MLVQVPLHEVRLRARPLRLRYGEIDPPLPDDVADQLNANLFETGPATEWSLRLFGAAVSRPMSNSLYYFVYKLLPNDTDFTVFKASGFEGLNFALIGNVERYHTPQDKLANLDLRSLQHLERGCARKSLGKDADFHYTAPDTSASRTGFPIRADSATATIARTEAIPSSISAPSMGGPLKMVSAKPSSWRR